MGLLDFLGPSKYLLIAGALALPWTILIGITLLFPVVSWIFTIPLMIGLAGITILAFTYLKIHPQKGCKIVNGKKICDF